MFTFSNPFFAYIKYTEVYFKRGKYLKKKKKKKFLDKVCILKLPCA